MSDQPPPPPSSSSDTTSNNTTFPNQNTSNNTNNNQNENPSLTSRIQSSTSTLAQNLFTPSPGDITKNLLGSSNNKAPPPSSAAASAAQSYHAETSTPSSSARGIPGHATAGDSFRSSATATENQQDGLTEEADAFQSTYHDGGLHPDLPLYEQETVTDVKGKGKAKAPAQAQEHQFFENTWQSATTTTKPEQFQNAQDGSEVLTLLTSPSFNPDFSEPTTDETLIPNDLSSDPTTFELSPAELQILDSFRRQLGPDPRQRQKQQQQRNLNPTSLIPDIDNFLDSVPPATQNDTTALRDAVLTGLPGAGDWVSVEERYQDGVWGYLKPVLKEARREMEEKGENGGERGEREEDGPAVARLKMILRHMRA